MKTQGEDEFGLDKIKVLKHLKTIQCESDPYKPKIWCDDVVELDDIFEEDYGIVNQLEDNSVSNPTQFV